jgi:hypothetical protein
MGIDVYAYNEDKTLRASVCLGSHFNFPTRCEKLVGLEEDFPLFMLTHQDTWHYWKDNYLSNWADVTINWYSTTQDKLDESIRDYAKNLYEFFLIVKTHKLDIYIC